MTTRNPILELNLPLTNNQVPPFGSSNSLSKGKKQIMRGGFKFSKRGGRDGSDSPLSMGSNDHAESPMG